MKTKMLTYTFAGIIGLGIASTALAIDDKKQTGWEILGLKGKVKQYTTLTYTLTNIFEEVKTNMVGKVVHQFDPYGNLVLFESLDSAGLSKGKTNWKYDSRNSLLEVRISNIEGPEQVQKFTYVYDAQGRETEKCMFSIYDIMTNKLVTKYTVFGKVLSVSTFAQSGRIFKKVVYKYDEKNILTGETWYKSDGTVEKKWNAVFDNGVMIGWKWYSHEGRELSSANFHNNEKKQMTRAEYHGGPSGYFAEQYEYHENGKLAKESHSSGWGMREYEYNDSGQITHERYMAGNQQGSYKYAYDKQGRCIERKHTQQSVSPQKQVYTCDIKGNVILTSKYEGKFEDVQSGYDVCKYEYYP